MKYVQCKRTVNYLILKFLEGQTKKNITFPSEVRSSCVIYFYIYSSGNITYLLCVLNDKHSWKFKTLIKAVALPILVWSLWDFLKCFVWASFQLKWWGFHCIPGEILSSFNRLHFKKMFCYAQIYMVIVVMPSTLPLFFPFTHPLLCLHCYVYTCFKVVCSLYRK